MTELRRLKGRRFRVAYGCNEVIPGIRVTMNLLEQGHLKIADHPSTTMGLRREMAEYSWAVPVKTNDHRCDAMRYVCYSLNWLRRLQGKPVILSRRDCDTYL